jgi:acetyltransferase-like isoleucine patch superfamily enzyme
MGKMRDPSSFNPLAFRLRRKLCWFYSETAINRVCRLKGRLARQFYQRLYPNFTVGDRASIWGRFHVLMHTPFESQIHLGDNLHMVSDFRRSGIALFSPCKFTTTAKGSITVGDDVQLNGVAISSRKRIEIGDGTLIAPNCIIVDSDFHAVWPPENRGHSDPSEQDREVVIGKNVWLGLNVTVLKGARIGDNSVIAAGSVVVDEIPANVIAAGTPARVVKPLRD